ncbi:MAG: hypothetical protein ABIO05_08240 [Ferruginibacter sp.]
MRLRKASIILFFCINFEGCIQKEITDNEILQNNLEIILDSALLSYNTLLPPPPPHDKDFRQVDTVDQRLLVYEKLISINNWQIDIKNLLRNNELMLKNEKINRKEYLNLFSKKLDTTTVLLDVKNLKTKNVTLVPSKDYSIEKKGNSLGQINISTLLKSNDLGLMVVIFQGSSKAGLEKLFFLENRKRKWNIVAESELSRW